MTGALKRGTRLTWRTMQGTASGKVVMFNEKVGAYVVDAGGKYGRASVVYPQDIIKIYSPKA